MDPRNSTAAAAFRKTHSRLSIVVTVAIIAIVGWVSEARSQTPFVTSVTLGTLRNDVNGWLGMEITVGGTPVIVRSLGRYVINGNTAMHTVKLVDANTGADVPNGSVTISMAGATVGQFKYAPLATPLTLSPNASYYIVSLEQDHGDSWTAAASTHVTTAPVATCDSGVRSKSHGWNTRFPSGSTFVPVDFLFQFANQPPVVNAGPDQTITLPSNASLTGAATDDGLPIPPGALTFQWSKLSGPGTATFANAFAASTTVSFSQAGTYVLRLSANDSLLSTADDISVTVNPAPPVNQRPVVNAGADQTITLPSNASLTGAASDDGLPNPPGALTFQWSKLSGPGAVTFANAVAASTTVSFSLAGTYVLRLSATDGLLSTTDDTTVTVNPAPPVNQRPVVNAGPDQTITLPSSASLTGTASDDGLPNPPGALTFQWSKLSGPGAVTFANAVAASTTVSFSLAGTYVLRLSANDSLLSTTDDITVTVNPASALVTVNITSPAAGATFTAPANITISATASSSGGSITHVDFLQGANLLGTALTSPYSITWNNVAAGNYVLTARATDSTAATGTSSAVNIAVNPSGTPANDAFVNAQVFSGSSGTVTGSNLNGTKEPGEPFHAGNSGGRSIWYQWIAPASSQTTVDTLQSSFNTLLAVYTGSNVSSLSQVGSNDDVNQTTVQSRLSFTSVTGTSYWIAVDGFNGASGNVVLRWDQTLGPPPPANDGFATAPVISGSVGSFTANNINATKELGEPNHAGNAGGRSVWYQWTAPVGNSTAFATFGSSFDTLLAIYTGNSVGALTQVASNNDLDSVTKTSRLTFTPGAGTTYFIAVDGLNAASGNFVLSWNQSGLGYLPDLTIWANSASNYQITNETFLSTDCAVVEGMVQAGTRKLLLFTTETRNVGAIDWWLGNPVNNPAFVWAPCHAHYHFNGFMQYRLLNGNGQLVAPGAKVGFCLTDSLRWDSTANSTPKYHCGNQGIQRGWGDVYTYVTSGQWIDITGVPDGYYTLEMVVNPQGLVQESDYSNNTVQIPVVIGQPGPSNDNFSSALVLSGSSSTFNGLNTYATLEAGEPAHAGNTGGHSIWFSWTAPDNQSVIIDTLGGSINTLLAVYTGNAVNSLSLVTNNDDIGGVYNNLRSRVIFNPVGGTVYRIAVDGYNGAVGNVTLNLKQPPPTANDPFANAQAIGGGAGTVTGDNLLATKELGEPNHAGNAGGHSIWYRWSASVSGSATIDTVGSDFDTMMAVYTGASVSGLTLIVSNDDIGGTPNSVVSRVSFNAVGGTTYLIAVDGYNGKRGYVTLNWSQPNGGQLGSARQATSFLVQKFDPPKGVQPVLACSPTTTGGVLIRLQGEPNHSYAIDFSTDLIGWTLLYTLTTDIEGRGILVDRSKPAGRVNLLDAWCGSVDKKIYDGRQNDQAIYYRVMSSSSGGQVGE